MAVFLLTSDVIHHFEKTAFENLFTFIETYSPPKTPSNFDIECKKKLSIVAKFIKVKNVVVMSEVFIFFKYYFKLFQGIYRKNLRHN